MKNKLVVMIIAGIALILIVGGGAYYLLFPPPRPAAQPQPTPAVTSQAVRPAPASAATSLSANWVLNPTLGPDGNKARYFDKTTGLFSEVLLSGGEPTKLSSLKFENVDSVSWSPKGEAAIIEYPAAGGGSQKTYFAFGTSTPVLLNKNIRTVAWSPDGKKIAYHYRDEDAHTNYIASANPNGGSAKTLALLDLKAVNLFWPTANDILILEKPAPGVANLLLRFDLKNNRLTLLSSNREGLTILPAPANKQLIFASFISERYGEREEPGVGREVKDALANQILDFTGEALADLPFATLASKCVWAATGETLYCAVPETTSGEETFSFFSWWQGTATSQDKILKYDYPKKETFTLAGGTSLADLFSLVLSKQENLLGFISRLDNGFYVIKL